MEPEAKLSWALTGTSGLTARTCAILVNKRLIPDPDFLDGKCPKGSVLTEQKKHYR